MAYKKKVWKTGDIMKQEDINNIENGIYEAHQELQNLHNYDDTQIKTDINTIKTDLGTEELTTTAKNVKGAVNEVNSQCKDNKTKIDYLDVHAQKIINDDTKFRETFFLRRNPYGTYQNASSFNIITNSNKKAQVLGISPKDDKILATYDNRDIVGIYNSISTNRDNIYTYENCNFTQHTVAIPLSYDISDILEGMIIDTTHSPKFSGLIKSIDRDSNTIEVYNWYQLGNQDLGQIPSDGATIKINNITKIWNINTNLYLEADDPDTAACGFEMGIINHQPHVDNVDAFDAVLMGTYGGNVGYKASGNANQKWLYGFYTKNSDTGFYSEESSIGYRSISSNIYSFLSNTSDVSFCSKGTENQKALQCEVNEKMFTIKNDGSMNALGLEYVVGNPDLVVNPYNTPVCIMTGNIQLVPPSDCPKKYFIAHNVATTDSSITAIMKKGTDNVTGISIPPGKSIHMYCDGSIYYILDFNLT